MALVLVACTGDQPGDRTGDDPADGAASGIIVVDSVPTLTIGNENSPDYQFSVIVAARRLGSGSILVADRGSQQLRFFDAAGKFTQRAGGPGEGPGEFRDVAWADVAPDGSIFVYDERLRRLSAFTVSGELTRTWRIGEATEGVNLLPIGFLAERSLVWSAWTHPTEEQNPVGSVFRTTSSYLRAELSDSLSELYPKTFPVLAQQPGRRHYAHDLAGADSRILVSLAFTPTPLADVAGGQLYLAASDSLGVMVYDSHGQQVSRIANGAAPATVEAHDVAALQEQLVKSALVEAGGEIAESDVRTFYARLFAAMPMPDRKPIIDALVVGPAGEIWVRQYAADRVETDAATWWVFSRSGQRTALLTLPVSFKVTEIGADYVLGVRRDEMGVEQVQLFELTRQR